MQLLQTGTAEPGCRETLAAGRERVVGACSARERGERLCMGLYCRGHHCAGADPPTRPACRGADSGLSRAAAGAAGVTAPRDWTH